MLIVRTLRLEVSNALKLGLLRGIAIGPFIMLLTVGTEAKKSQEKGLFLQRP
ncbi:MAG: hypothetical protein ACJA0I_001664 [Gammaproteobacteria bacterium]|jgi:hypothetical protein